MHRSVTPAMAYPAHLFASSDYAKQMQFNQMASSTQNLPRQTDSHLTRFSYSTYTHALDSQSHSSSNPCQAKPPRHTVIPLYSSFDDRTAHSHDPTRQQLSAYYFDAALPPDLWDPTDHGAG